MGGRPKATGLIYDIPCGGCEKHYIGDTSHFLGKRMNQRKNDYNNNDVPKQKIILLTLKTLKF